MPSTRKADQDQRQGEMIREALWLAFVAGFVVSGCAWNGELVSDAGEDPTESEQLRELFVGWMLEHAQRAGG